MTTELSVESDGLSVMLFVGLVMVFGEITTNAKVDYEAVVRKTCREIGFTSEDVGLDADKCKVCFQLPIFCTSAKFA